MRRIVAVVTLAAAVACSLPLAMASSGSAGPTVLVSGPNLTTATPYAIAAQVPAISGDGRFVAFLRSPNSAEAGTGIFLRDMSGDTIPVDVPSGAGALESGLDAGSPSLSSDGRYLAFASEDPALSEEDRNSKTTPFGDTFPIRNVFVYDRLTGSVSLVSRRSGPTGAAANNNSNLPAISADGGYVAFGTEATNLFRGAIGGLYVRNLHTDKTTLAGRAPGPQGKPLRAFNPSISGHGRWVAFVVSVGRPYRALEIEVRDMKSNRTILASRASASHGAVAADDCSDPAISANGRYVAFATKAKNLSPVDGDSTEDVFVRDLATNRTVLVSRAAGQRGAPGNGDSSNPSISADGRYVAFESYANNLDPPGNGATPEIFVRDMRTGRVSLASRGSEGRESANGPSRNPSISSGGQFVAFESRGSNLSPEDTLHSASVFRAQLLP